MLPESIVLSVKLWSFTFTNYDLVSFGLVMLECKIVECRIFATTSSLFGDLLSFGTPGILKLIGLSQFQFLQINRQSIICVHHLEIW